MVAIGRQDAVGLLVQPLVDWLAVADAGGLVGPHHLGLEVDPLLVCRLEGGAGRAKAVDAQEVEPVVFQPAPDPAPDSSTARTCGHFPRHTAQSDVG